MKRCRGGINPPAIVTKIDSWVLSRDTSGFVPHALPRRAHLRGNINFIKHTLYPQNSPLQYYCVFQFLADFPREDLGLSLRKILLLVIIRRQRQPTWRSLQYPERNNRSNLDVNNSPVDYPITSVFLWLAVSYRPILSPLCAAKQRSLEAIPDSKLIMSTASVSAFVVQLCAKMSPRRHCLRETLPTMC